jgi:uncharacterized membrane protein YeiH
MVVVVGLKMKMQRGMALRMVAAWQHWNLPRVMVH